MNADLLTQEEINEIVSEAMSELPVEIQSAIENSNWHVDLRALVQKYRLRIDQGTLLENHTFFVMLGINKTEDLVQVIQNFGLEESQATALLDDIESQVFGKIKRQVMAGMTEEEKAQLEAMSSDEASDEEPAAAGISGSQPQARTDQVSAKPQEAEYGQPSRSSILSEIEKEPEPIEPSAPAQPNVIMPTGRPPLPVINLVDGPAQQAKTADVAVPAPATVPVPSATVSRQDIVADMPEISQVPVPAYADETESSSVVEGVQADPIAAGLSKATITASMPAAAQPPASSADPYREPIE